MSQENRKKLLLKITRNGPASELESLLDIPDGHCDEETETTWLHRAARYGRPQEVKELIRLGATVDIRNKMKMTPLHCGAISGNAEVVRILLSSGADVKIANEKGITALHWASSNGFDEALKELLGTQDGRNMINALDHEGFTPLHRCCQEKRQKGEHRNVEEEDRRKSVVARLLLENGADLSILQSKGQHTVLHLCAMNNLSLTAQAILSLGGESLVNFRNKIGMTPLLYAVKENHLSMVKVLLQHGADPLIPDKIHFAWNAFHFSVLGDNRDILKALVESHPLAKEATDDLGRTPMMLARESHRGRDLLTVLE